MQQVKDEDGSRQGSPAAPSASQTLRIKSEDLFRQQREVEIDHQGRIYRLRLTQMNKLILTA
ncbi:hemin transporter [Noviherbaspirillum denitrificans]|uniref:Hemin transporter n=2 Tax=Noviherbaspirillum denitrificans TaxID=1968433 RepID=A0A254TQ99_9BURK|nr:hemin transporter [Noviherbaspirillum denitrificans]